MSDFSTENGLTAIDAAPAPNAANPPLSTRAIVSFATSAASLALMMSLLVGGWFFAGFILLGWPAAAVTAIILGNIARGEVKRNALGGRGLAIAGLVIGLLSISLFVLGVGAVALLLSVGLAQWN